MQNEFRVECEECDAVTIVLVEDGEEPSFCSICGRRAEIEDIRDDE